MSTASEVPVYVNQVDPAVEELCRSAWTCQLAGSLTELWSMVAIGLAIGAVIASVGYLRSARSALVQEQSRTAAEQEAFEAFARRVAELPTASVRMPKQTTAGAISVIGKTNPSASALEDVLEAYRKIVMDLSHYEEDYGEPLRKNMADEFGVDIASSIHDGDRLTPQLQHAIISAASRAARERASLLGAIGREEESLCESEGVFSDVRSALDEYQPQKLRKEPNDSLLDRWDELNLLEERCSRTLAARQQRIKGEPIDKGVPADKPSLFEYLYQSLAVNYPVLATGTTLIDQIQTSRRTLTRIVYNQT